MVELLIKSSSYKSVNKYFLLKLMFTHVLVLLKREQVVITE